MDRSRYPEGVEARATDFDNSNTQTAFHVKQRLTDVAAPGVAFGLAVTINNADAENLDIEAGWGYTPRGDFVQLLAAQEGVALTVSGGGSYVNGTENLICLVYGESSGQQRAHETSGNAVATRTATSTRVRVFTQAEYDALAASEDDDLTIDAQDRVLIIGNILGAGLVGSDPNDLDYTDLSVPTRDSTTLLYPTWTQTQVSGLTITQLADGTAAGSGKIKVIVVDDSPLDADVYYFAPGDAYGAAVAIEGGGTFFVYSADTDLYAVVAVTTDFLPKIAGTYEDLITFAQFYADEEVPRLSARDNKHRTAKGGTLATPTNPHGVLPGEAAPIGKFGQGIVLGESLLGSEALALVPRQVVDRSSSGEMTALYESGAGSRTFRIYRTTGDEVKWTINARYDGTQWNKDQTGVMASMMHFGASSNTLYTVATGTDTWAEAAWVEGFALLGGTTAGSGRTGYQLIVDPPTPGSSHATGGGFIRPTYSGTEERWQVSAHVDDATGVGVRTFARNDGTGRYEIAVNCSWDGSNWNRDIADDAMLYAFTGAGFAGQYYDASADAQWDDGDWEDTLVLATKPGDGSIMQDGRINWGTGLTTTGNPAVATSLQNTLCAKNTCKAWVSFTFNGSDTPTIHDGFNVSSVSADETTGNTTVSFGADLSDTNYSVVMSFMSVPSEVPLAEPAEPFPLTAYAGGLSPGGFNIKVVGLSSAAWAVLNPEDSGATTLEDRRMTVQVFGQLN